MRCPRCGYELATAHAQASSCPQCGLPLPHATQQPAAGDGSAAQDVPMGMLPAPPAPYGPYAQPAAPSTPLPQGYPPYPAPPVPGMSGGPGQGPSLDPSATNPYGVSAAPSTPFGAPLANAYGVPAGPSVPYGFTAPYAPWGQPPVAAPPNRTNRLLIAVLIISLVAIVGGSAAALLALTQRQTTPSVAHPGASTQTPDATILYQSSLQGGATGWSQSSHCMPSADGYHVQDRTCFVPIGMQQDVDVSVQVEQVSGDPIHMYGLAVRSAGANKRYDVGIDSNGEWVAARCDGDNGNGAANCRAITPWTANSAIHGGLNTTNTLELRAKGTHFELYVNSVDVGGFDDATYVSGRIGLVVGTIECVFTNIVIKRLSS